jgi:hypothetical protein
MGRRGLGARVSLWGKGPGKGAGEKKTFLLELEPSWHEYLKETAASEERSMKDVVMKALILDRALGEKLSDVGDKLVARAAAEGLSYPEDLPELLARLIRRALEAGERPSPKRKA